MAASWTRLLITISLSSWSPSSNFFYVVIIAHIFLLLQVSGNLFIYVFIINCVCLCMWVRVSVESKRQPWIRCSWSYGVLWGTLCSCWTLTLGPLQEHHILLGTEPSLQVHVRHLKHCSVCLQTLLILWRPLDTALTPVDRQLSWLFKLSPIKWTEAKGFPFFWFPAGLGGYSVHSTKGYTVVSLWV